MAYKCEVLADSISEQGHRLTTFELTYPRIIHAEMLRHRMLSRNVASSRAIPFEKMVKDVEEDPFIPIAWQKRHSGMQGNEYITHPKAIFCRENDWRVASYKAIEAAKNLNSNYRYDDGDGITKQLCNRLLEPFMWTTELVSGTEWENFFELRCPQYEYKGETFRSKKDCINSYTYGLSKGFEEDRNYLNSLTDLDWLQINKSQAEIHIQKIAEMMWDKMNESVPKTLKEGQWHIPYSDNIDESKAVDAWWDFTGDEQADSHEDAFNKVSLKIATARAARISYTTLGSNPKIDYEADIKLHNRLLESKHLSCFEHCARVMTKQEYMGFYLSQGNNDPFDEKGKDTFGVCNNYRGFIQYRYLIENQ